MGDREDRTPERKNADNSTTVSVPASASLAGQARNSDTDLPVVAAEDLAPSWRGDAPILCVSGRSPLDEAAASLLAQLLGKHGLRARVMSFNGKQDLAVENVAVRLVCISHVSGGPRPIRLRIMIRRLQRQMPNSRILVGLWTQNGKGDSLDRLKGAVGGHHIATTLREAVEIALNKARIGKPHAAVGRPHPIGPS